MRLLFCLAAALLCWGPARAAEPAFVVSRDGHFQAAMPDAYASVISQYPPDTHGHIVAAWSITGPGFKRLEISVQSLRHMSPEQLAQPAAASCARWAQLDDTFSPCRSARLAGGYDLFFTVRGVRKGADALTGFFDLGQGLVYCVLAEVPSGSEREAAVSALLVALGTIRKADAFDPASTKPKRCEAGDAPVYENWPHAGDWRCRPVKEEGERVFSPTDEPYNPIQRVKKCPPGLTLARVEEPLAGDYGCVNFVNLSQRLLDRFNQGQVFKCAKNELPVIFKRDGRKRDFICEKDTRPKPPSEDENGQPQ